MPCADAIFENSNNSFHQEIAAGGTLVLDDNIYNIYVNLVLKGTGQLPSQVANVINII